jgi:hypothetical protein
MRITIVAMLFVIGCTSGGTLPPSAVCEETSECEDGLECLPFATFDGPVCTEVGTACTKTCETDADCAVFGASFKCFANCDGKVCGDTASP